jgi:prepilin-type N-terminal cleavage/methylation domain-containing protein
VRNPTVFEKSLVFNPGDLPGLAREVLNWGMQSMTIFPSRFGAGVRRGFTLIELLTVIAIIGILAAILIPTISKVRETARYTKGLANLREIARGNILFAQDNKGWIPHDGFTAMPTASQITPALRGGLSIPWWNAIPPYLSVPTLKQLDSSRPSAVPKLTDSSVFVCPNAASTSTNSAGIAWLCYAPSYKLSDTVATAPEGKFLANVNRIREPSRTVLFAETTNHAPGQTGIFSTCNPAFLGAPATATTSGSRWKGKSLVSFFDGSVKSYTSAQLLAQSTNLKGDLGGPIWDIQ